MKQRFHLISLLLLISLFSAAADRDVVRILAIGNSFSEDAVEQNLHEIAAAQGQTVIIGNLYIGGCSIDTHYDNMLHNKPLYRYRKIHADGRMTEQQKATLKHALQDEKWDIITFQQASQYSGDFNTLGRLPELMKLVRQTVGDKPTFAWHQTWAYSNKTNHAGFEAYGKNQLRMYHDIQQTGQLVTETYPEIKILIPCGTAIQDARTALIAGDDLTRDGYHLEKNIGRYIAACTWYVALFRNLLDDDTFAPKSVSPRFRKIAHEAAHQAVLHPDAILPLAQFLP